MRTLVKKEWVFDVVFALALTLVIVSVFVLATTENVPRGVEITLQAIALGAVVAMMVLVVIKIQKIPKVRAILQVIWKELTADKVVLAVIVMFLFIVALAAYSWKVRSAIEQAPL